MTLRQQDIPAFQPLPLLANPHLQTLAGNFLRRRSITFRRHRVTTPDEDFIDLDIASPGDVSSEARRVVLILHGLEGCSRSGYVRELSHQLLREGITAVAMNFRGCSGEMNRRVRSYHSGETGDVQFVINELRTRFPDARMGVVGFSLGGNVLLKLLGESGPQTPACLQRAAVVSAPFDLAAGADHMERGLGYLYSLYFLPGMIGKLLRKELAQGHGLEFKQMTRSWTLRRFDDFFTAPIHGFDSAEEYYRSCSSKQFLEDIRVPTLVLHSRDDPLIPFDTVPVESLSENKWIKPHITDSGGHVGFLEESNKGYYNLWAERTLRRFFASMGKT